MRHPIDFKLSFNKIWAHNLKELKDFASELPQKERAFEKLMKRIFGIDGLRKIDAQTMMKKTLTRSLMNNSSISEAIKE